jgi:hypothetical protein
MHNVNTFINVAMMKKLKKMEQKKLFFGLKSVPEMKMASLRVKSGKLPNNMSETGKTIKKKAMV